MRMPIGKSYRQGPWAAGNVLRAIALSLSLTGCSPRLVGYRDYHGDGAFNAQPATSVACPDRYTVDLGPLAMSQTEEVRYELKGLPSIESVIGVAVTLPDAAGARWPVAQIALTLRDDKGTIVLARHEALADWTRSYALADPAHVFLYQRGTEVEVATGPGIVRVERFPIGPDDSWGTYFTPRRGASYTLHWAITTPDAGVAGGTARLQVRGVAGCP